VHVAKLEGRASFCKALLCPFPHFRLYIHIYVEDNYNTTLEVPEATIYICKIIGFYKLHLNTPLEFEGNSSTQYGVQEFDGKPVVQPYSLGFMSRANSARKVTGYELENSGFIPGLVLFSQIETGYFYERG
jgi:hypothetical protein